MKSDFERELKVIEDMDKPRKVRRLLKMSVHPTFFHSPVAVTNRTVLALKQLFSNHNLYYAQVLHELDVTPISATLRVLFLLIGRPVLDTFDKLETFQTRVYRMSRDFDKLEKKKPKRSRLGVRGDHTSLLCLTHSVAWVLTGVYLCDPLTCRAERRGSLTDSSLMMAR